MIYNKISMRDAFFDGLYDIAKKDRELILVVGDMGAPSLDKFRKDLPEQFVNVGIAENNMIGVAAGLASEGKNVYTYAIAPFATSRCYEFTKVCSILNKAPVKIIGVGPGFSYSDSGPTHHTTEDISIMRALPGMEILSPSDSNMSYAFAQKSYESKNPTYLRLDREIFPVNYDTSEKFEKGFMEFEGDEICIIATGNTVHLALEAREKCLEKNRKIGVINLYKLNPINPEFKDHIAKYKNLVSLEEHLLNGGLGSIISETITDNDLPVKLKRIGLENYVYEYGGRKSIQEKAGIDIGSLMNNISYLL